MKKIVLGSLGVLFIIVFFLWHKKSSAPVLETNIDLAAVEAEHPLRHLAFIMDGNRRWAKRKGLKPWYGHKEGVEAVKRVVEFCLEKKIPYLTLYTFSLENFARPMEENNFLFYLMKQEADKGVEEFKKYGVRIRFLGDRSKFPHELVPLLDRIESETADMNALQVNCMFCYGARQEIAAAAQAMALHVKSGALAVDAITPELLSAYLLTSNIPDPDLIIRTGGYSRLSNFLLFQAAYSEIRILNCLWPDITKDDLENAYEDYCKVKRNFGS